MAASLGDLDGDGLIDVTGSERHHLNQATTGFHYLAIDLVRTMSNRDGIGATAFATTGDSRQRRDLMAGDGWSQDEPILHFGLGPATSVDALEIRWPSGHVDIINDIPADQLIRVIEGRGEWYPAPRTVWDVPPPANFQYGEQAAIDVVARPALFEPSATITRVVGDLSGLGGPEEVPLIDQEGGSYRLQAEFMVGGMSVERDIEIFIEQSTSLGPYWVKLSRNVEVLGDPNTAIVEAYAATVPDHFKLQQNYPNPFNSSTIIRVVLPTNVEVDLAVYNLAGQKVATLVAGARQAGTYTLHWDGHDDGGRELASGAYLYRLRAGERMETRKMLLLR